MQATHEANYFMMIVMCICSDSDSLDSFLAKRIVALLIFDCPSTVFSTKVNVKSTRTSHEEEKNEIILIHHNIKFADLVSNKEKEKERNDKNIIAKTIRNVFD